MENNIKQEEDIGEDTVLVIKAGIVHGVENTSREPLKIFSVFIPPLVLRGFPLGTSASPTGL